MIQNDVLFLGFSGDWPVSFPVFSRKEPEKLRGGCRVGVYYQQEKGSKQDVARLCIHGTAVFNIPTQYSKQQWCGLVVFFYSYGSKI